MPKMSTDHATVDRHADALRDAGFVVEQHGRRLFVSLDRPVGLLEVQQVIDGAGLAGTAQRGEYCVIVEVPA